MKPDWWFALLGGGLIGLAATVLLLTIGRICGISGIAWGIVKPTRGDLSWRWSFFIGLLVGAFLFSYVNKNAFAFTSELGFSGLIVAGLLVGFGTRYGGGCTSGHGVCGLSRLSQRSIVATCAFMVAGALTVFLMRHVWGIPS